MHAVLIQRYRVPIGCHRACAEKGSSGIVYLGMPRIRFAKAENMAQLMGSGGEKIRMARPQATRILAKIPVIVSIEPNGASPDAIVFGMRPGGIGLIAGE